MKKLGKLKLNKFSEMSDKEMKTVVGGVANGTCGNQSGGKCSGACPLKMDGYGHKIAQVCSGTYIKGLYYDSFYICSCIDA